MTAPIASRPCCHRPADDFPDPRKILEELQLGPVQRTICNFLVERFGQWVPSQRLVDHVYAGAIDGGPLNDIHMMSVTVVKTRKRLRGRGITIEGRQWSGYRMVWEPKKEEQEAA